MGDALQSKVAAGVFDELAPIIRDTLLAYDEHGFADGKGLLDKSHAKVAAAKTAAPANDETTLNELFIVAGYLWLLSHYGVTWEHVLNRRFSESWLSLQDALDSLRMLKRLSRLDVGFFEDQLTELEKGYPYKLFLSYGAVASRIECSICGQDIDSISCPHRRGRLYAGKMACGIIREFKEFDHAALVLNPEDKRCVVSIANESHDFQVIGYLADLLSKRTFMISEFREFEESKRRELNPNFKKVGRNDPCFCGSGKKFKNCCIDKQYEERRHMKVLATHLRIQGDGAVQSVDEPQAALPATVSIR